MLGDMTLAADTYLAYLRQDAAAMVAAARRAPIDAAVPACPGWDLHELMAHTSGVHRWVTAMVSERTQEPISRRNMPAAPEGPEVIDWFEHGASALIETLSAVGSEASVWNWTDSHRSYFWFRRQAQETAVHRCDAQSVSGAFEPVPVDLAVDGLDEMLTMWVPDPDFSPNGPWLAGSLHIHLTDADGEWMLTPGPGVTKIEWGHGKADAAVRGTASNVLLYLWNRDAPVESFGDPAVMASWREHLRI